MTRVAYAGHEPLTFADYTDQETGKTLYAEPGRVYDITPASGRTVPDVPEPWFVAVDDRAWDQAQAGALEASRLAAEAVAAGDDGTGESPDGEPQPEPEQNPEGQSF